MKNLLMFVVLFMVGSIIGGCAKHTPYTAADIELQRDSNITRSECYRTRAVVEGSLYTALAGVPKEDRAFVMILMQQNSANRELVAAATGANVDPCSGGSNLYDVSVAELRAQADQTKSYISAAKWVAGVASAAYVASDLVDAIGGSTVNYLASDNGKINVNSQNQDSGNVVSGDYLKTGDNVVTNTNEDMIDSKRVEDNSGDGANETCEVDADCENGQTCSDGVCTGDPDGFNIGECIDNPPGGWRDGIAMWDSTCSCASKADGKC